MKIRKLSASLLLMLATLSTSAYAWYDDNCCDQKPCNGYTYDSCSCWGGYFVYENVIVRPYFSRNNAYVLENPNGVDGQSAVMFDWDFEYSPRFELGWNNDCGLGLRGRYWNFDHETTKSASSSASPGKIGSMFADDTSEKIGFRKVNEAKFKHKLQLDVADFEVSFNQCKLTYSAGGLYVHMKQKYRADAAVLPTNQENYEAKHDFSGGGLTTAVEYFQPAWCGFSVFTKARGSIVYGDSKFVAINDPQDAEIRSKNERDLLGIAELQLGLDWRYAICDMCAFVRFAVETQTGSELELAVLTIMLFGTRVTTRPQTHKMPILDSLDSTLELG